VFEGSLLRSLLTKRIGSAKEEIKRLNEQKRAITKQVWGLETHIKQMQAIKEGRPF